MGNKERCIETLEEENLGVEIEQIWDIVTKELYNHWLDASPLELLILSERLVKATKKLHGRAVAYNIVENNKKLLEWEN